MSEWAPEERPRLPRLEDLPVVQEGYDPGAVAAAFDSFYRHAAKLDTTLSALDSVEAFRKEAADLRADIRALRAAAWGPLPGRETWAAGYAVRAATERRGGFLDVAPRIAVEAAFIILVAVGAAIADLGTTTVVLLVVAAWLVVGLAEVLASLARPAYAPALRPAPEPAAVQPAVDPWEGREPEPEPEPVASLEADLHPAAPEPEETGVIAAPEDGRRSVVVRLRRGRR